MSIKTARLSTSLGDILLKCGNAKCYL